MKNEECKMKKRRWEDLTPDSFFSFFIFHFSFE